MKDILQKLLIGTLALGLIPALWGFTHFAFGASPLDNPGVTADDSTVVWTGTHTNTAQSCFLAFNSVTDSNVTGAGQLVTVDFDTEVFDQGSDFASDTFTAPVTGKYNLSMNIRISGITAAGDSVTARIVTTNRVYEVVYLSTDNMPSSLTMVLSVIADMDATETATVAFTASGESGDNVVDLIGNTTTLFSSFSGCLIS